LHLQAKLTYILGWIIINYIIYEFQLISTSNYLLYSDYIIAYIILKVNRINEIW